MNDMIHITLPDGSVREYPRGVTGQAIAESISKSLAKEALVIKVDGELKDLVTILTKDARVEIVTAKHPDALEVIRHDTAHLLAEAAKELYGKDIQVTIGPAIENGFYYDFAWDKSFTPEDLITLENKMREIVDRDEPITRAEWDRDDAIKYFESLGEKYKAEIISDLPKGEVISMYSQGNFTDLCRGPHAPSTKKIGKAFKLLKLAGAYWRGDSNNPMLQRVYGTAWASEEDLKAYLYQLEEAEKRDHRKLGREMNLFHQQQEAMGDVFWHPKGWVLYRKLQEYLREKHEKNGYQEINTPILMDYKLWQASGHWEKFREGMFATETEDKRIMALKPMNCPGHVQIFNQGIKSYRDLPLRFAEYGCCHRNEPSGSLHGIMRVRHFVQDDAHIFCTEDQILDETINFCKLLKEIYNELGFENFHVRFSDRPAVRAGSDETWDKAEATLKTAIEAAGIPYTLNLGEGAFYGPKLEFVLKDAIGREWQCGTWQLDYIIPERLGATYMGEDGKHHRPVMLHRTILGTFERFIGVLLEHYAGRLPFWLSPVQAVVAPIISDCNDYAVQVCEKLKAQGLRVETDLRNEKINYKIREHSLAKIPVIMVLGKREAEENTVTLRYLGDTAQETLAFDAALDKLKVLNTLHS